MAVRPQAAGTNCVGGLKVAGFPVLCPMVKKGDTLNLAFEVEALIKGEVKRVHFADLVKGPTLVSVYMRNNTSACDKQVDSLAAHAAEFRRRGYALVALSRDKISSHLKYAEKKGLNFVLVSDPEDLFSKAADAIIQKSMYGKKYLGPARAAYVLGAGGRVEEVIEKVEAATHGEQLSCVLQKQP